MYKVALMAGLVAAADKAAGEACSGRDCGEGLACLIIDLSGMELEGIKTDMLEELDKITEVIGKTKEDIEAVTAAADEFETDEGLSGDSANAIKGEMLTLFGETKICRAKDACWKTSGTGI